jgi:hypothetical protein
MRHIIRHEPETRQTARMFLEPLVPFQQIREHQHGTDANNFVRDDQFSSSFDFSLDCTGPTSEA